jgi:hypothetical protein
MQLSVRSSTFRVYSSKDLRITKVELPVLLNLPGYNQSSILRRAEGNRKRTSAAGPVTDVPTEIFPRGNGPSGPDAVAAQQNLLQGCPIRRFGFKIVHRINRHIRLASVFYRESDCEKTVNHLGAVYHDYQVTDLSGLADRVDTVQVVDFRLVGPPRKED